MKKKLVLTVYDANGEVSFSQDPSNPDSVIAALTLFNEVGTEICIAIRDNESK